MKMRNAIFATVALLAMVTTSDTALAKNIPAGGMTVGEIASWLQAEGYKAQVLTAKDGSQSVTSGANGYTFHIYALDCKAKRCASVQFSTGIDTKGALSAQRMNQWNHDNRWIRAYVDKVNDPWLELDVDLSPGGTYESLDDQFQIWRTQLAKFRDFIGQ
jgi:hypothetical protein